MIADVLTEAGNRMTKAVEVARDDFATVRTGRANPALFQRILVDYYGTPTPLQQLASFTSQDARTILIAPYDISAMSAVEKAIRDSDLGVNPTNDGSIIRVAFPQLTEERRKDYTKVART